MAKEPTVDEVLAAMEDFGTPFDRALANLYMEANHASRHTIRIVWADRWLRYTNIAYREINRDDKCQAADA